MHQSNGTQTVFLHMGRLFTRFMHRVPVLIMTCPYRDTSIKSSEKEVKHHARYKVARWNMLHMRRELGLLVILNKLAYLLFTALKS